MIQHSVILLFVGFVPRNVPLRRKERRQEAANVRSFSCRISKTQLGEVVFRRYIDGATLIRDRLCAGGLYLADIRCPLEGPKSSPLSEVIEEFGHVFAHVAYIPEWPNSPKTAGNNVFIATDAELSYPEGTVVVR